MNEQDRRLAILEQEKPLAAVLKMGLPVVLGMLFMVAYNLTDTYFIGLLHDDYQLAAANLSYPLMMVMIALAGIVGNGGASYIARCLGQKRQEEAERTLMQGFLLIAGAGLLLALAGFFLTGPIVRALGGRGETFAPTFIYTRILLLGGFFTMGNYAFGQLLRSEGSVGYAMAGMILGTLANIVLDPLLIFTAHLGIAGAAIATVLGNALATGFFLLIYLKGRSLLQADFSKPGFSGRILKEILLVGVPHTLEQLLAAASILVLDNLAALYGGLTVAAMGISSKIMSVGSYVYQGMTAGCQPLMGYNYGRGDYGRLKKVIGAGIGAVTVMELFIMGAAALLAPVLVGLFSENPTVTSLGVKSLRAAALMLPFVGTTAIVRNFYNAAGMPARAFLITTVRQLFLYIPFLLLFNRLWGYEGLISAQPAEELCIFFFSLWMFKRTMEQLEGQAKGGAGA